MALFEKINNKISKGLDESKYKYFWLFFFLFIILILAFQMVVNTISTHRFEYTFFYTWLAYFIIVTGIISFNLRVLVPRFLLRGKLASYILSIVGCVLLTMFLLIFTQYLFFDTTEGDAPESLWINLMGNLLSIGMIIISTSVYALFRGWAEYSQQVNELEASTKEAELQQLKSQVNPHFLFNTINNVNIKVERDPQQAFAMITKLEDLLRYQLTETSHEKVFLKDDISFFNDYLELESTRRSRFSYSIKADDEVYSQKVFPLLFIPFVENAVKHSLMAKGESIINITFTKIQDSLFFSCENTKPSVSVKHKSGGLGLKNIKRRLELLYENTYTLDITESENKYIVNLWLKI
ncbi:MAG: histidine kinase [Dysgonomonas sp.]|nr:histidine kinase [Dysgonomonas sp.]